MREIYTSPRPKNVDRVVALLAEHGIETRIRNRTVYDRQTFGGFSYGPGADRSDWERVEVKFAKDLTPARALLKEIGIAPVTRFAEELEISRNPRKKRDRKAFAVRLRSVLLLLVGVAFVIAILTMNGVI
ncbi:MAG TPA: DUF2007 domain-containing protein [Oleiagrimonas sp.]|nr:DUF2007 domain-containing protein [Oleiagrimonas sp.]